MPVAANSAIGFDRPSSIGAASAHRPMSGAFSMAPIRRDACIRPFTCIRPFNGGRRVEAERPAGPMPGRSTRAVRHLV